MTVIVVRRIGALGDVILATPVVRHLRAVLPPEDVVLVQTAYPAVFDRNPHVAGVLSPLDRVPLGATLVDFGLAYERLPHMHVVDAYSFALTTYGFPPIPTDRYLQELFPPDYDLPPNEGDRLRIAMHAARSWPSRTLPMSFWMDLVGRLRAAGAAVVPIGTVNDLLAGPRVGLPLGDTAAVLASCDAFIGSDSAMLHAAAAVGTPVVGLFTSVRPEVRMPVGGQGTAFVPEGLDCWGCHGRRHPVPVTDAGLCERGDMACLWRFDAGKVAQAALAQALTRMTARNLECYITAPLSTQAAHGGE